jgi:hypothetical protein
VDGAGEEGYMSHCIGEGCDHPSHVADTLEQLLPKASPDKVNGILRGDEGKPAWMGFSDGRENRQDRRRAQAKARQTERNRKRGIPA